MVIYAVAIGRRTGIVDTWEECKSLTYGFTKSEYKMFQEREAAENWLKTFGVTPWGRVDEPTSSLASDSSTQPLSTPDPQPTPESVSVFDSEPETSQLPRPVKRARQSRNPAEGSSSDSSYEASIFTDDRAAMLRLLSILGEYGAVRIAPIGQRIRQ
ncbi:hypothetical protein NW762_010555 [Fusarium torreyae]|uniref:Ribonuclease H1 N-terminal domain-containing protein n=1 Tax=Fusarium torreyae TaxID=1237075 RepID=A0A9W8RRG7_9HYPO|nr:hypothetical protein NW762_010555 [Fusarium torreyae]